MNNVEFNPENNEFYNTVTERTAGTKRGLTHWLMKLVGIQDENKANAVMLVVAIIFFLVSGLILWYFL